jgi:hypothetical protein
MPYRQLPEGYAVRGGIIDLSSWTLGRCLSSAEEIRGGFHHRAVGLPRTTI